MQPEQNRQTLNSTRDIFVLPESSAQHYTIIYFICAVFAQLLYGLTKTPAYTSNYVIFPFSKS